MIRLILPIPPSTNTAYRNTHDRGGRALTNEAKDYKSIVHILTAVEARKQAWSYSNERLGLSIALYFPNRHRRDIAKLLTDSLAKALGFDDCVIDRLFLERRDVDRLNPRAEVTLVKLGES